MHKYWILITLLIIILLTTAGCNCNAPQAAGPQNEPLAGGTLSEGQVDFSVTPADIKAGDCAMLRWNVPSRAAHSILLNGQKVDPAGEKQVCPQSDEMYSLDIDMGNKMIHKEVVLHIAGAGQPGQNPQPQQPGPQTAGCGGPPVIPFFDANPAFITTGQTATLEWGPITNGPAGTKVKTVTVTPGSPADAGSPGSLKVSPSTTTTYTLTATGCGGTATKSVTVQVGPPGGGSWSGPAKVTNVKVYFPGSQPSPLNYTGPCTAMHYFNADITVDGPCTVTYRWERSDGAMGAVQTLNFSSASAQQISDTWTLGGGPGASIWERVQILTPLPMTSAKAIINFSSCTP